MFYLYSTLDRKTVEVIVARSLPRRSQLYVTRATNGGRGSLPHHDTDREWCLSCRRLTRRCTRRPKAALWAAGELGR